MSDLITVFGRTLSPSGQSPSTLTYTITETYTNASKTCGKSETVLIKEIQLHCDCAGDYAAGQTFAGSGDASIQANTNRVKCEGESILLKGDNVSITCNGTVTTTSGGATSPGSASVTVTITNTNQTNIFASKT